MAYSLAPSEARVRLGVDGTWSAASDRWINVYADDQDCTDESMATQFAFPVAAGTHTFDLYAARYDGGGEATMYDPVLTVAAVPAAAAAICSEQSSLAYTNAPDTPTPIRACSLSTATPAHALVFGSASIGRSDPPAGAPHEGRFRLTTAANPCRIPSAGSTSTTMPATAPTAACRCNGAASSTPARTPSACRAPLLRQRRGSHLQRRDPRADAAERPPVPRRCRAGLIALLSVPPAHRRARRVRPASARARDGSAGRSRRRTVQAARRAAAPRSCR